MHEVRYDLFQVIFLAKGELTHHFFQVSFLLLFALWGRGLHVHASRKVVPANNMVHVKVKLAFLAEYKVL